MIEHPITEPDVIEELKAIAHPLRLRILQVLRGTELNVGEIDNAAGIGQPALSQQLGVLRKAGLVETRKDAKLVYYRLASDRLSTVVDAIAGLVETQSTPEPSGRTPSPGAANFARLS
jgi:DNA-binding transcriptional ArsR family regulator